MSKNDELSKSEFEPQLKLIKEGQKIELYEWTSISDQKVKYIFIRTCGGFSEQYDVYEGENKIAYIRLRHGSLTAEIQKNIFEDFTIIYTKMFSENFRFFPDQKTREAYLLKISSEISKYYESRKTFQLTFKNDWLHNNLLIVEYGQSKLKVTSKPIIKYNTWYFKILNFLMFKKYFNVQYVYKVRLYE